MRRRRRTGSTLRSRRRANEDSALIWNRNNILAARDRRQELLDRHLSTGWPATIFLSLNIPGKNKNLPGVEILFGWALERLKATFPGLVTLSEEADLLGPFALMALPQEALSTKQQCVTMETSCPAARLIDLDVYDHHGVQISRQAIAFPPRPCLICDQPAVECMRLGRHSFEELVECAGELVMKFIETHSMIGHNEIKAR